MEIRVETTPWHQADADWLVVAASEAAQPGGRLAELDEALGGQLARLCEMGDLTGKLAEILPVYPAGGVAAKRLLVVGLGRPQDLVEDSLRESKSDLRSESPTLDVARFDKAMTTAARKVSEKKDMRVAVALPQVSADGLDAGRMAQAIATAFTVGGVGQGIYRKEPERFPLAGLTLLVESDEARTAVSESVERGRILGEAMNVARDLINRMADEIYPESFAERASRLASECGLDCQILDEKQLKDERMGALLAVALGSDRPPRMVVLGHRGGGKNAPTLGLVGKGVTFDSGGLSLKPTDSMTTMKGDMAGAATVLGAMTAIARLKLPVNVMGFMGLVENMISGSAFKLGDVLTARNGVTIEVLNTDAEGRLVLADVLSYAVDQGVERMIDLATLTGSCVVALGEDVAGVFTNDQPWCDQLLAGAKQAGEPVWQLPMFEDYAELLKSDVADCKNVAGRWGGSITAAKFLEKFVGGRPWVHIDIAGPAFASSSKPHREGGGTGVMVRTLVETAARLAAVK